VRARTEVSQLGHAGGSWERSARRRRTIPYPMVGPHDGKCSHQCGDGRLSRRRCAGNCRPRQETLGNPALPMHGPRAKCHPPSSWDLLSAPSTPRVIAPARPPVMIASPSCDTSQACLVCSLSCKRVTTSARATSSCSPPCMSLRATFPAASSRSPNITVNAAPSLLARRNWLRKLFSS
jgi:hypothetical protein